jgi:hypothetical protein
VDYVCIRYATGSNPIRSAMAPKCAQYPAEECSRRGELICRSVAEISAVKVEAL